MSKNSIFFSHSSKDKEQLVKLKELFVDKTGGAVDVFLSSDGQSIPLGRNWVHRIQEELNKTTLLIVFLTHNSIKSSWVYFEAGYSYSKNIRVVPVGFMGVDLSNVPPPLSLLQGFNISNKDGLDNLIALINEEFGHSHASFFTDDEFNMLISDSNTKEKNLPFFYAVEDINFELDTDELNCSRESAINILQKSLETQNLEIRDNSNSIECFGLRIFSTIHGLDFNIDPNLFENILPVLIDSITKIVTDENYELTLFLELVPPTDYVSGSHKITALLLKFDIQFGKEEYLNYKGLNFKLQHNNQAATLIIKSSLKDLQVTKIYNLVTLLFDSRVLYNEYENW